MGAQENKQATEDAYRAFSAGDAEGAMANMDDGITWKVRGDNSLTGTYNGKQEIGQLWAKFAEPGFSTEPREFIADGNKVAVLTTVTLAGESAENVDILTFDDDGRLVEFESIGETAIADRVFA